MSIIYNEFIFFKHFNHTHIQIVIRDDNHLTIVMCLLDEHVLYKTD